MCVTTTRLLLFLTIVCSVKSARILAVFPIPGSHYILGKTLLRALAERGHDVTMISLVGEKNPPKNGTYRDIVLTKLIEHMKEIRHGDNTTMYERGGQNVFVNTAFVGTLMLKMLEKTLEDENIQKLIHSDEKFDVVIVQQFVNDAQKALATHFEAPLITFSSMGANYWINSIIGNPAPPSYIPDIMTEYLVPMTFFERVVNTLLYIENVCLYHLYIYPRQNEIIKKYIPNGPDINDVLYNSSLVLLNSHPSINAPVPYVPNMIDIGGFHIQPPKKLPQDLQEFLDGAKDGVIYFSMGSRLKSAELPPEKRDALIKTFSKLKEKVLWKWEEEVLPGQPSNVKLSKWLPQQDILAHPNVKLFITHGGLLSTTETIYHGVPILAIPIMGDQKLNAKVAVNNGFGLSLSYDELTEENLSRSINEILTNPKYKNNAKRRSQLFHDRLVSPMDTAIYWVEYIIRHKGASHLRVAALDLPWYQYFLLDVITVLLFLILLSLFIFYQVTKAVLKKLCAQKKKTKKVKRN